MYNLTARKIQHKRFKKSNHVFFNAQMSSRMVRSECKLGDTELILLKKAMEKLQLSARAYDRILKVARTAADLDGEERISTIHLSEAINYRNLDRDGWAG